MSDDVVVMEKSDLQVAREMCDLLETTIECLGAAHLTQVQVGGVVMDCAVFMPSRSDENEGAQ